LHIKVIQIFNVAQTFNVGFAKQNDMFFLFEKKAQSR